MYVCIVRYLLLVLPKIFFHILINFPRRLTTGAEQILFKEIIFLGIINYFTEPKLSGELL